VETPQPPQVSVSGSIIIEGHLTAPSSPSLEVAPAIPPPLWWKFWQRWRDFHKVTAYATLLLAGAAFVTLIVTHCDNRDIINQANIAATEQHKDTIEALTTVQRAFVYTRELQFVARIGDDPLNPTNHPLSWWFTPIIENSGSTPTKQMRIVVIASCGTEPLRVNFGFGPKQSMMCQDMPDAGPPDPGEIMTHASDYKSLHLITASLGPRAQTPVGGFGMPPDYIRNFPKNIYFWGAMQYNDVFENTNQHITKYCYAVSATKNESGASEPLISLCPHWNCADAECDADRKQYTEDTKGWVMQPIITLPATPSKPNVTPQK
jgi:hypothetical protein